MSKADPVRVIIARDPRPLGLAGPRPGAGRPAFLDAAKKQAVVDEIATLFNKNYIFAETAKKVEEALRAKLKAGDFDKLDAAPDFARAVGGDHPRGQQGPAHRLRLQSRHGRGPQAPRGAQRGGGQEGPGAPARGIPAGQFRLPQGRASAREHRLPRLPRFRVARRRGPDGRRGHELPGLLRRHHRRPAPERRRRPGPDPAHQLLSLRGAGPPQRSLRPGHGHDRELLDPALSSPGLVRPRPTCMS